ncbi:MerR family transcriptional regulator [Saccharopolyspora sp. NFXS83]|uniref:MerR family transcriptional regulator n=1 Tax=Saccharopolyspora sp. NFXS83 TaxID=2993560 RepID=UPI00224B5754|nr:MerR family transcriptional regulator [Saccharopolyspora sp. NFXS83]MCX2732737.1 MerR family transcriptional regulator [Saccharopolyspora sp. NFXS83]
MTTHMQIGEVAERTGLSLRTIRYYEEVDLAVPSARTQGGFRLYREADVRRLEVIMRMKPLGFQLDEMRELLGILDAKERGDGTGEQDRRLAEFRELADRRCEKLRRQLELAEDFAATLESRLPGA